RVRRAPRGRPDTVPRPPVPERHRPGRGQGTVPSRADRPDDRVRRRPGRGVRGRLAGQGHAGDPQEPRAGAAGHRGAGLGVLADARVLALPAARPRHPVRGRPPGPAALRVDPGRRHRRRPEPGADPVVADPRRLGGPGTGRGQPPSGRPPPRARSRQHPGLPERGEPRLGHRALAVRPGPRPHDRPPGSREVTPALRRERRRRADRGPYGGRFGLRARRGSSGDRTAPRRAVRKPNQPSPGGGAEWEAFFQESPGSQGALTDTAPSPTEVTNMTTPSSTEERDDPLPALLAASGQERALRWWPELTPSQRQRLHQQLAGIDLEQLQRLFRQTDPAATPDQAVRPAPVLRLARTFEDRGRDWRARAWGKP